MRFHALAILGSVLCALPAMAGERDFTPIPAEQTGGKASGLQLRIVRYDGGTNGVLTVEVKNPRAQAVEFAAKGLYFVPDEQADKAPQRLGAVGPFSVDTGQGKQRRERVVVPPGDTVQVKLDVYCFDSHRRSPTSSTPFRLAKDRVPAKIVQDIARDADSAAASLGGVSSPRAKSAVQSEVWKNRDKKWIELEGEGQQELMKK